MKYILVIADEGTKIDFRADAVRALDTNGIPELENTPAQQLGDFLTKAAEFWMDTYHMDPQQRAAYMQTITVNNHLVN